MPASTSVKVRPAAPADAPCIAGLLADLGYPAEPAAIPSRVRALAAEPTAMLLVAERDGMVMVAAQVLTVVHADRPVGWITALVVAADHQGLGVGRVLLTSIEQWLQQRGCGRVAVTTHLRRHEAHAFYEHSGYVYNGLRYVKPLTD